MQPVPQTYIDALHKARGSIRGTLNVLNAVEQDQYIPLEDLLDSMKHMVATIPEQRRKEVQGYVFGSGRVNYDESRDYISYQKYLPKLTNDYKLASIGETQAHAFLAQPEFYAHLEKTIQASGHHISADEVMHGYMKPDGKREPGVWDDVSRRFAEGAHGHIITISSNSDPNRVMVQSELPAFIENENILTINGFPAEAFVDAYDEYTRIGYEEFDLLALIDRDFLQPSSTAFMKRLYDEFSCDRGPALGHDFNIEALIGEYKEMFESAVPPRELLSTPKPLEKIDCRPYGYGVEPDGLEATHH